MFYFFIWVIGRRVFLPLQRLTFCSLSLVDTKSDSNVEVTSKL